MGITQYKTITIGEHFIYPIECGYTTGITDDERELLDKFITDLTERYPYFYIEYEDKSYFARCEITGIMSNCVDAKLLG